MAFDLKSLDFKAIDLKKVNWRSLQRLTSPQAANDLNAFLEKLPGNAGQAPIIAAGAAWALAALIGLFCFVQAKALTTQRAALHETKALQPLVPKMSDVPVGPGELKDLVTSLTALYPDLTIKQAGATINITAKSTANFAEFREAIGETQNGGSGWRVAMTDFCVGRECQHEQLSAGLKISKVSVDKPH